MRDEMLPDATTLWLFREKLAKTGLIQQFFDRFEQHHAAQGYMARGGQMIDAMIVSVRKQRISRDENEAGQTGEAASQIAPEGR